MPVFCTECVNPLTGQRWSGPPIFAHSFEDAEKQVLQIRYWLTNMGYPSTGLKVLGEVEEIIPAEEFDCLE